MSDDVLIAGGGARGLFFAKMLTQNLGRKVAAIADTHKPGHDAIRVRLNEFGTPGTQVFGSVEDMLAAIPASQAGAVFVMTPQWTHLDVFRKAIDGGRHVFLEKPIATTREDVLEILRIARSTDLTVQVGFVLRYSAFYRKISQIVESGRIGRVLAIQMNERLTLAHGAIFKRTWHRRAEYTGGFMNEKCCHDLDIMCWIKQPQAEPVEVFSYGGMGFCRDRSDTPEQCAGCAVENCPWPYQMPETFKTLDGKENLDETSAGIGRCVFHSDADVMDHQTVMVKFGDGSHGTLTAVAMSGNTGRDIVIHGSDGYLDGVLAQGKLRVQNYWEGQLEDVDCGTTDAHGGGDLATVQGFLDCVAQGLQPLANVEAGARASLLALAADESVRMGKPIRWQW